MGKFEVLFTARSRKLLERIKSDEPELALVLGNATCCAVSNVFARRGRPGWETEEIGSYANIPIYVHPGFKRRLGREGVTIDAMDFTDYSLSLETNYGKRFMMILSRSHRNALAQKRGIGLEPSSDS